MSKRTPAEAWRALQAWAGDDEIERVAALSDAELDSELRKLGADPVAVRAEGEPWREQAVLAARQPRPKAPVVPRKPARRTRWAVWLAAATLGAVVVAFAAMNGPAIVTQFKAADDIRPDEGGLAPPSLVARRRAEELRNEAAEACERKLWGTCESRLDEANKLDPAGETQERVQQMRKRVDDAARVSPIPDTKRQRP
jgi:hypothetical protein